MTCTSPKLPTMTFDGLRSQWMTPPRVCIGHRLANLLEDPEQSGPVLCRGPALAQERRQIATLDQLHGEIGPRITQGA